VAAAVAERLPGLRLQGAVSLQDSSPLELLAAPLWSLLAAVTAPLFDGGRRSAEVERQRAVVAERLASFGQVLLVAMAEVETALGQERSQEELLRQLAAQVELAGATVREARDRYREGQIEYLPVLSALQAEQQSQLALLQAQRQQLSLRVQLYRALGGSHVRTLQEPELARPAAAR
jgi:outer membrane protein TolC